MFSLKSPLLMLGFAVLAGSCGSGNGQQETAAVQTPPAEAEVFDDGKVHIALSGDDQMRFDKKELRVPAGSTVRLVLTHKGKIPKNAMGHNFVLLQAGADVMDFANKAAAAISTDYIPESEKHLIIAHTRMLGGGEFDAIEFVAPEPGMYPFLCSFPAHAAMMKGVLISE